MMTLFVSVVSQHSISNHSNKLIFNVKYNLGYNFKQLANSTELLSFSKKKKIKYYKAKQLSHALKRMLDNIFVRVQLGLIRQMSSFFF